MSQIIENFPLLPYNTFQVEANTRFFIEFKDTDRILAFLNSPDARIVPRFVLGGGSNVLFTKDFEGIILHPALKGIEKTDENSESVRVRVGAGERWDDFVEFCVAHDWGGVENLSLIPGSIGACPVQNIGAYGAEVGDVIDTVEAIVLEDNKKLLLTAKECRFAYRDSIFKRELCNRTIITHVTFRLRKCPRFNTSYPDLEKELDNYPETTLRSIREAVMAIRSHKLPDPAITGNAGSFFKNPVIDHEQAAGLRRFFPDIRGFDAPDGTVKLSAAWLIEHSGWKGRKTGRTGTHKRQPLIIVNYGGATGEEIFRCAKKIQKAVMNHFAIRLEMEVNVL
jgi:UDP-N-acetylmuramate dehydrogenase